MKPVTSRARWTRVFNLRRKLIPYIIMAGERPPVGKEEGPQRFVCLSDDFDDVLYGALESEARIERDKHVAHSATGRRRNKVMS